MIRRETEEKYKEICRLFRSGKKIDEIAEEVYCSRMTVTRALSLYGDIPKRETFEAHKEEITAWYSQGMAVREITERTGLSGSAVRRNLRERGYSRKKGWKPEGYRQGKRTGLYAAEEPEGDLPLYFAPPAVRKAERIVIRGKTWLDVSAWFM